MADGMRTSGIGIPGGGFAGIGGTAGVGAAALKELVLDEVLNVDPTDKPCQTLFNKVPVSGVEIQWALDTLRSPTTAAASEGFAYASATSTPRYRVRNFTQIFSAGYETSETTITQSQRGYVLGTRNEQAYQAGKTMDEVSRDIEATLIRIEYSSGAGGVDARYMKSLYGPFSYNFAASAASGNFGTSTNSYVTAGQTGTQGQTAALTSFNTADVLSVLHTQYLAGLRPNVIMAPYSIKRQMARTFLNTASGAGGGDLPRVQYNSSNLRQWEMVVDVITTDYGRQMLIPNIWMQTHTATATNSAAYALSLASTNASATQYRGYGIFDTSKIAIGVFRPLKAVTLPPNGDSQRGYVVGEYSLLVKHPTAVGWVLGVTA